MSNLTFVHTTLLAICMSFFVVVEQCLLKWFPSIFSHSIVCLFTLLIFPFVLQKMFSCIYSHIMNFASVVCAYGSRCHVHEIIAKSKVKLISYDFSESIKVSCVLFRC